MESKCTPELSSFNTNLIKLERLDRETFMRWYDRVQPLLELGRKRDSPDSTSILMDMLVSAIEVRGWTLDLSKGKGNDWAAKIECNKVTYSADSSFKADALLSAYIAAMKKRSKDVCANHSHIS